MRLRHMCMSKGIEEHMPGSYRFVIILAIELQCCVTRIKHDAGSAWFNTTKEKRDQYPFQFSPFCNA